LEFDLAGKVLPTAGTYKTVLAIDTAIAAINAPYTMSRAANSEYSYDRSTAIPALAIWDTVSFGNSANMATKTTWACPATGLWHIAAMSSFIMNTNDQPCTFQLYHNGSEVWHFTAWYNNSAEPEGITTQCESIFLNLATGNTLEWYLLLNSNITMTIGVITTLSTLRSMQSELPQNILWRNWGCCNKYIVGVPLLQTTIIKRKVEHLKSKDTLCQDNKYM